VPYCTITEVIPGIFGEVNQAGISSAFSKSDAAMAKE
jgi:hypothetical protein